MKRLNVRCFAVMVIALSLGACTKRVATEGPTAGMRNPEVQPYLNQVVVLDDALQKWEGEEVTIFGVPIPFNDAIKGKKGKIAVESTRGKRSATGTLEASAVFRNRTDYPLQFQARTVFFDRDMDIVDETEFERLHISSNSIARYGATSTMVYEPAYYRIELKGP